MGPEQPHQDAASHRDFHHPFQPYDIQIEFMNTVYDCLEQGQVGILESPTGTGKSLSLICGSLTWLRDFRRRQFQAEIESGCQDGQDEPEWLVASSRKQKQDQALKRWKERERKLQRIRQKEQNAIAQYELSSSTSKRFKAADVEKSSITKDSEHDFLLDDCYSEDERVDPTSSKTAFSAETQALLEKLGHARLLPSKDEEEQLQDETKIFFCSRTHSQLTQFASELRRVRMPAASPLEETEVYEEDFSEEVKYLTLGSRKQLCINPKVSRLLDSGAINERCLELQQTDTSPNSKCSYLPAKDNNVLVNQFRDHTLARIKDIEDLGELGKKTGICPYYASRGSLKAAEIVTLPYPLLLQKSAREALGLSVKGHVVIIDEAHNLLDSISNIHSVSISLAQLNLTRAQLSVYLQKFSKKLSGKNKVYVNELVRLIDSLIACTTSDRGTIQEIEVEIGDLLRGKGVDQINLYKLMVYLRESKLARKVDRYINHREAESSDKATSKAEGKTKISTAPVLTHVHTFLLALTNPAREGRFFLSRPSPATGKEEKIVLRYVLLDPTFHFREIVEDARAVILAGGTMSPMSDYTDHLFRYLPLNRLETLSCGHIIPKSNLLVLPISNGPGSVEFDFTFERRNSENLMRDLGCAIIQAARRIPDGLVIFFPSYAYLDKVIRFWQDPVKSRNKSEEASIWARLEAIKKIFMEPKASTAQSLASKSEFSAVTEVNVIQMGEKSRIGNKPNMSTSSTAIDKLLQEYASHIHTSQDNGAILFAVIGGSLSEGINFSDRLGRGVIVIGLPYPNAKSAEWKAKLEFVRQRSRDFNESGNPDQGDLAKDSKGVSAAKDFYENACMRAVNQSIGRAIRHKNDFATIMLFDKRYGGNNIQAKLPAWVRRSINVERKAFKEIEMKICEFFEGKGHRYL